VFFFDGKKQLFYFFKCWISRWKKNKCAVCAAGFRLAANVLAMICAGKRSYSFRLSTNIAN